MKRTKFMRENKAVAGVIEALLMVALVAIILSVIQRNMESIRSEKE